MNLDKIDAVTLARISTVMGLRFRDTGRFTLTCRGGHFMTREDRYNAILHKLRARMLAPRMALLVKSIERTKGWTAYVGGLSNGGPDTRQVWRRIDKAYHEVNAALALLEGEDRIDEAEVVAEVAA
jgi:hypothetical protein